MIRVEGLKKRYEHRLILRGIDFQLAAGEAIGIRGANGSGKSTLIQILAGRLRATGGSVTVEAPLGPGPMSWLGHQPGVYLDFTARENLEFFSKLAGTPHGFRWSVDAAMEEMGISGTGKKRVRAFSRGMKQRVALARLMVEGRSVWLLDEPGTGLDVVSRGLLGGLVAQHQERGGACILVSHHEDLLTDIPCRVLTLSKGVLAPGGPG